MKNLIAIFGLLAAVPFCPGEDITSYSIPKNHPAIPAAPEADASSASVHWKLPAGWKELAPTGVRIGNFLIPGANDTKAEVAITSFPGAVGTEADNVNRWRREIGLAPLDRSEITSEPVTIDSTPGRLYDFTGKAERTVVASLPRAGVTWFFKMRGDKSVVAGAKPAFLELLKNVHFTPNGGEAPVKDIAAPITDPHAGLAFDAASPSSPSQPQFDAPANWIEQPPGPMVLKTYSVAGDGSHRAVIAISSFPGRVGGTYANVNRWRGQLGLPPIGEDELPGVTKALATVDGKAVLVDLTGTDARTSQPAHLVAAIVARGESTWFYKLIGDDSVVAREKAGFVKFVQNVRYP